MEISDISSSSSETSNCAAVEAGGGSGGAADSCPPPVLQTVEPTNDLNVGTARSTLPNTAPVSISGIPGTNSGETPGSENFNSDGSTTGPSDSGNSNANQGPEVAEAKVEAGGVS